MSPRKKVTEDQQVPELETVPEQSQQAESPKEPASVPRRPPSSAADILILNDQERGFTPEDSEDVKWNYLSGAMHTHKILTGVVSGIETLENGNIICAVDYEGVRILVPGREMFMDTWPEDSLPSIRYQVRLRRCLGATIDFMLSGIDFTHRAAVGSRREALKQRQARYYGTNRVKVGSRVACRVIGVGNNRITVEAVGVDSIIPASE